MPCAASSKLIGMASELGFGDLSEHRDALRRKLSQPRRSIAHEFAQNEGGLWYSPLPSHMRTESFILTLTLTLTLYLHLLAFSPTHSPFQRPSPSRWHSRLPAPRRDEYEYVVHRVARQQPMVAGRVVRDDGHDGWTLDDFCSRPLARVNHLTYSPADAEGSRAEMT